MPRAPHWSDPAFAAALDPSGGGNEGATVRLHAQTCALCSAALAAAGADERLVAQTLDVLDHPVPAITLQDVLARASRAGISASRAPITRKSHGTGRSRIPRWGVGIWLLGAAAVAATAMPGLPLHTVVTRLFAALTASERAAPPSSAVPPARQHPAPVQTTRGVAIMPHGPVTILFRSAQRAGFIRVRQTGAPTVAVHGAGSGVTYIVGQDTIVVGNASTDVMDYDVELPAHANGEDIRICIEDRVMYRRVDGRVIAHIPARTDGRYVIPFSPVE